MASYFDGEFDFGAPPPPSGSSSSAGGIGEGMRPPNWVPDDFVETCMSRNCETEFTFWQRRHHCRLCGGVFCASCTEKRAMMPDIFGTRDPQRVCEPCYSRLEPLQDQLAEANANAMRHNEVDDGSLMRYFNSPARFTLGGEVRKAAYTVQNLIDGMGTALDDGSISLDLFRDCDAIMIITVCKLAFLGGIRFGTGLVVCRNTRDPTKWSAPCAVILLGMTFGAQMGGSLTDLIIPMHDKDAVAHFSVPGGSHIMLGGEAGLALGPIGRSGEASMHGSTRGFDTAVSYSHSRGLYSGITVDGALVKVRDDVNQTFYGSPVNPAHLFDGRIEPPPAAAPLYEKLELYESRTRGEGGWPRQQPEEAAPPPGSSGGSYRDAYGTDSSSGSTSTSSAEQVIWSLTIEQQQAAYSTGPSMYQTSTPEQRQQAACSAAASVYNSSTPEQRQAFAEAARNTATATSQSMSQSMSQGMSTSQSLQDDSSVFI